MPKKIYSEIEKTITQNEDGTEHITTVEKTRAIERSAEPDFIKLYTRMWCEFTGIPDRYRLLFLELIARMSYCNKADLKNSQIVYTGEPVASDICHALGWKQKDSLMKGLKELCKHNAIKKINRAVYQINPSYAGRGEWKYNPRLNRGGVEDLVATFNFSEGTVETNIIWGDDGEQSEQNDMFRAMLDVSAKDSAVLTHTKVSSGSDVSDGSAVPTKTRKSRKKEVTACVQ